ncbi:MAG: NAD-dependent epimerase/dehydratase family protein [Elusimicrobiota bacterium]
MPKPRRDKGSLRGRSILITGGAGMIGSAIARQAVAAGAKVSILDNLAPQYGGNLFNLEGIRDRIRFVYGDIREMPLVAEIVRDQDVIFNLAAQVSYVDSNLDPFCDLDINCRGHLTVLEACRKHNPKARLVFSSSRFVYGDIEYNPVDENHPYNCLSMYGVHKLNGEKYYHFFQRAYGLEAVIFRIANPYGPCQQMRHSKYGILNWFVRQALEGKPLTVYGDGKQKRDYIYVEDLARAMLMGAAARDIEFGIFNLGTGHGVAFREMAEMVARTVRGTTVETVEWPKDRYFVETGDYITDIRKVKDALGWEPQVRIEEGIRRTVEYYRRHARRYGFLPRDPKEALRHG